jgi:serine/threonine protein kinase
MIGQVFGNYRIEREIGEGGMSHVYVGRTIAASDVLPAGFEVVLKVMSEELAGEVTARKRFVKEAQILSKLRHRYITRFYEFLNDARSAVLVMEFVEGTPGDIKPANLIREPAGVVKVTDFGIAKIKEGGGATGQTVLTKSGFLLGTPHYMSPEQIREPKDAGAKCDIYSAGVVLYEMLTGTLPFNSRSLPKLIDAIYRGDKPMPRSLRPEIDAGLEEIVLKSMHPRHEQRYESAREFYEALEEYTARQPIRSNIVPASAPAPAAVSSAGAVQWSLVHVRAEANEKHPIQGDNVMVGRDRTCSIVLSHPAVSRRHARMTLNGASWVVEDLKSANGTYVNNTRVERMKLKPGDVVRFGADPSCSYVLKEI